MLTIIVLNAKKARLLMHPIKKMRNRQMSIHFTEQNGSCCLAASIKNIKNSIQIVYNSCQKYAIIKRQMSNDKNNIAS